MNEIQLIASQQLGDEAKAFLKSNIGQLIIGCAEHDVREAKDDLLKIDPYEFKTLAELQSKISSLQLKAKIALQIDSYLSEAITSGEQASHQLQEVQD